MLETDLVEAQEMRTTFERSKGNMGYVAKNITLPYRAVEETPVMEPLEEIVQPEDRAYNDEPADMDNNDIGGNPRKTTKVCRPLWISYLVR